MKGWYLLLLIALAPRAWGEAIVLNQVQPALDEQAHNDHPVALYHPALPGMSRYVIQGKRSEFLYVDTQGNWYERFEFRPLAGTPRQLLQRIVRGADGAPTGEYRDLSPETRAELKAGAPRWAFSN